MSKSDKPMASQEGTDDTAKALSLRLYQFLSRWMGPLATHTLKKRLQKGKEDPARIDERRGLASKPRPDGKLIWIHGASVGESLSILPLIERLHELLPHCHFLVTSGTITSAQLMAERLPECATHQYVPVDHPTYVNNFLDHWKPDIGLFVESEIWPNLISLTKTRNIPMALINGRMSPKSYKNWLQRRDAIAQMLKSFSVIMGQDTQNAQRLAELARRPVPMLGNLKMAAPKLPVDEEKRAVFSKHIQARPHWLAASTHEGEEEAILDVHQRVARKFPDLFTFIVPRHPNRGKEVAQLAEAKNITYALRSTGQAITPQTSVYIADTMGELGIFYRLSDISFVGGSLVEIGGHNPLEPARLGSAILYGPHIFNFEDVYKAMRGSGGTALVRNERDLAASLIRLLTDDVTRASMAQAAEGWAETNASEVLDKITEALDTLLQPLMDAPRAEVEINQ